MLIDLKSPKHRRILLLLAISIASYAISSIIFYLVAVHMPLSIGYASTRVGFLVAAITLMLISGEKIDLGFSRSGRVSWIYGICFGLVGILLFAAYKSNTLASIIPLVEGGILVFLVLDLVFHRKKLSTKQILMLVLGAVVVFMGTFFAESSGLVFNLSVLPYAIGLMVTAGVGYYALANNTKHVNESSKQFAFVISGLIIVGLLLLFYHSPSVLRGYSNTFFLLGAIGGFLLCIAFAMEIRAVKYSMTGNEGKNVLLRNFINSITELEIVIVLIGSVAIGSFTFEALFGGALIVVGVIVLGAIK
jgi:hypothetical protein